MDNQSKKIKKIEENSSAIFSELFGFGRKKDTAPIGLGVVEKLDTGKYKMGKSIITGLQGASDSELLNYDFENSNLNWLLDCEFIGILNLDLRKGILNSFGGIWKSGIFKGLSFSNHSTASFEGGEFGDGIVKPRYMPSYDTWKISPINFIDGTIGFESGGILGIADIPNGPINNAINILSIKPGKAILLTTRSKTPIRGAAGKMEKAPLETYVLSVSKRIDSIDSDFIISLQYGVDSEKNTKRIPWSEFRKRGESSLIFNPGQESTIFGAFGISFNGKYVIAEIIESGKDSLNYNPKHKEVVDTVSKAPIEPVLSKNKGKKINIPEVKSLVNEFFLKI